jgi:hypothetical protein
MQELSRNEPQRGRIALIALLGLLAAVAFALTARPAGAATATAKTTTCPGFRVLHNDRIGAAVFPAGSYTIQLESASLTCKSGSERFTEFLEIFNGVLPSPWKTVAEGSGKAAFTRGSLPGFSVSLTGSSGEGGSNPELGTLCQKRYTVAKTAVVGRLRFTKGSFLIYLPTGSKVTCTEASSLFTAFLGAGGKLPSPWQQTKGSATFYQPSSPVRTAFRIEPLAGSGRR